MAVAGKQSSDPIRPTQARQVQQASACACPHARMTPRRIPSRALAGQAGADRRERRGDGCGIARPEGASLEQRGGDRLRQHREADRGGSARPIAISTPRDCAARWPRFLRCAGSRRSPTPALKPWRSRSRRAAIRRGGLRSRATTPRPARMTRPWRRRSALVAECRQRQGPERRARRSARIGG